MAGIATACILIIPLEASGGIFILHLQTVSLEVEKR